MPQFPTRRWLTEYARRLDECDALDEVAAGWGERFDGDVLLVIEDLPVAETTVGDLPPAIRSEIPGAVRSTVSELTLAEATDYLDAGVRAELPASVADLLDQLDRYVADGTVRAYVGLEEGRCTGARLLAPDEEPEVGFEVRGSYPTWRQILEGRPALSAAVGNDLSVRGNVVRLAQYAAVFHLLGDVAAEVETTHLFDGPSPSAGDALLDGALRGPITVQQEAQRRAAWVSRTLDLV
ncbi:sterol carrier protein [Halorarius halobius]|uniref:sterol carrier protein n=1 Tax=Halorarius halobius TaxID=2962671 RepID=UPI0020CCA14C|nr:sterol carrier protein [Halorarius halobius]